MHDSQPSSADLASGLPAVDRYLADGFLAVRGMSSRFAACVSGALLRIQTEQGITGHIAEIGTFEGRFFIALAHALAPGERAIGIDHFSWPDAGVRDRFERSYRKYGPEPDRITILQGDSRQLAPRDLLGSRPEKLVRFFHIDGEHDADHLSKDFALAYRTLAPAGVICLDDMLHPGYPLLALTVHACLGGHPDLRVFCVVDREDIVAAAKFMICRAEHVSRYANALAAAFPEQVWGMRADFIDYSALVLAPAPRLAEI
jgi:predicted O-methyltransferase YrrM